MHDNFIGFPVDSPDDVLAMLTLGFFIFIIASVALGQYINRKAREEFDHDHLKRLKTDECVETHIESP